MADNAETSTTTDPVESTDPQQVQGEPAELGEGGTKALKAEREARKALEKSNAEMAARLKAIEDRDLSELDKAKRDLQEALGVAEKARAEALRFKVAAAHAITDEDAEIFLTGADEDSIKRQAERLVALRGAASVPGTPRPDMSQGATTPLALNGDGIEQALKRKLGIT